MAGILNIGVSALLAYQRTLSTTGHNIANANTEGYTRQRTLLATHTPNLTGAGFIGSGVKVTQIQRTYDDFIATQMRSTQSTASELEAYYSHASRIDNVLSDPNIGLDPAMQDFFNAMQVLADDPSSVPTRQLVLSEAESLVDRFHDLNRQFSDAREKLNQEIVGITDEINNLVSSIARVNQNIVEAIGASGGNSPNDLLDEREVLFNQLSEKVDIKVVPQDNGAWNVFTGKGLTLVMGSIPSELSARPSADDISRYEVTLTNSLGSMVISDQLGGGQMGGLLAFRDQILDSGHNQLGLLAVCISERLNSQHQLGLDLNGQFGGQLFSSPSVGVVVNDQNTGSATVAGSFVDTGNLTSSDYELRAINANDFVLTRLSDNTQVATINTAGAYPYTTGEIDGFDLTLTAGAAAGDTFVIRPVREAAGAIQMALTDPRKLAAASPVRAQPSGNTAGGSNQGNAAISQPAITGTGNLPLTTPATITLEYDSAIPGFNVTGGPGGTIAFDPATQSNGATFTFPAYGGMSFSISGTPTDGDQFVIENNSAGVGDNRNALIMAGLQTENTLLGQTGGIGETATFQESYGQMVSGIGAKTHQAEVSYESVSGLLERHTNALLSVSGVNLDEEAANLVKFQQAYQAAAQVITVASTLFDTLIAAVRR
ncbi:MAG: flagellar hook-associated protein FlgK [Sedimenticola sp.]|nr:MAG: flagellar hook-associated protein FlgK [Sedimenticola sp.]